MDKNNIKGKGLSLLKKGQKGLFHAVFGRLGIIMLLLLLQLILIFTIFLGFQSLILEFFGASIIIGLVFSFIILNSRIDPSGKLTWVVLVMALPVFGSLLFLYSFLDIGHRTLRKGVEQTIKSTENLIPQDEEVFENFEKEAPGASSIAHYLRRTGSFPVFDKTEMVYSPIGEETFEEMLTELRKAEKFIFLEYFIIDEGIMWGKILEILAEKVKQGVDVRLLYDGTNEFVNLPRNYPKLLKKLGIRCKVFSPLSPFISTHYNYRDHRKIMVIDGKCAFTGGINFADRYINREVVYGHWKDTSVMLRGKAVQGFTLMFLQMWNLDEKNPVYEPFLSSGGEAAEESSGFVIPYGDCPLDGDKVGEMVYMDMLNRSKKYVHIMSPYLILDGEMETAIRFAAERGVEVSIILPGMPDKIIPYSLAKSHYAVLLDAGVHIYEYTPGFVHAKSFVSDDDEAVVGTINLDYRSLYHHFECAAYCYKSFCIKDIEKDFEETLGKCRRITKETIWKGRPHLRIIAFFMKVLAPLL